MRTDTFWREVEETWGLLTSAEVLQALNMPGGETASVSNIRDGGQLLAVKREGNFRFPGFQFVAGHIEPVIAPWLALADEVGWSQDELVIWLCSPSGYFGGDRPVVHLHDHEELIEKARNEATVEW